MDRLNMATYAQLANAPARQAELAHRQLYLPIPSGAVKKLIKEKECRPEPMPLDGRRYGRPLSVCAKMAIARQLQSDLMLDYSYK